MDRAVPFATSEGIDLYLRTYYSLLRSSGPVRVRSLEDSHASMRSSLHLRAESPEPDVSAFLYAWLRLPREIIHTQNVLLGQSRDVFARRGYPDVESWQLVRAPARRRRMYFDGQATLAAFIASVSDIDDLIPILVAFQIEWNKMHHRLNTLEFQARLEVLAARETPPEPDEMVELQKGLEISPDDMEKLQASFGADFIPGLLLVARREMNLTINLLAGSLTDYRKAVQVWWQTIEAETEKTRDPQPFLQDLNARPVYFVSSNTHSLPNALTGYALRQQRTLIEFIEQHNPENLRHQLAAIQASGDPALLANLLYYTLRLYLTAQRSAAGAYRQAELDGGILAIPTPAQLDVSAHVIEIGRLHLEHSDPRLHVPGMEKLAASRALILNVDYPLGMAAYHILSQVTTSVPELRGAYFMGKAATLNGRVGDVMIPNVVYDEQSENTYLFKNCFAAADVAPYLRFGTVFDNQKSITVRGTFLQNREFMHIFYREGYTDIEMEAGPYLSALYEDIYARRYPVNEIVNLFINAPYDIGVLHYASDTPYSRRQELLSKSLSYFGVDSTYATTIAILRRILQNEIAAVEAAHESKTVRATPPSSA